MKPKSIRIVFASEAKYAFKVECSVDRDSWTSIAEISETLREKVVPMDGRFEGLFYRITFAPSDAAQPGPAVSEFEIIL